MASAITDLIANRPDRSPQKQCSGGKKGGLARRSDTPLEIFVFLGEGAVCWLQND